MTSFWGHQDNPFPPADDNCPICPICGENCTTVFRLKKTGEVYGCNKCIREQDAWEWQNEQEEPNEFI